MSNEINYFQFTTLREHDLPHAIFQRHGGVSPKPWDSLNLGGGLGDKSTRVNKNRDMALDSISMNSSSLFDVWQVHSSQVVRAMEPRRDQELIKADAMVTNNTDVSLLMRFADCVPIFIYDPEHNAVGIAHAGWLGTSRGVSSALVHSMVNEFQSNPKDLLAGIGPSIGPCHYEIREDVLSTIRKSFSEDAELLIQCRQSKTYFDLWSANRYQLEKAGLTQVEVAEICTVCHNDRWYSHRAEQGKTGRFGAVIACKHQYE